MPFLPFPGLRTWVSCCLANLNLALFSSPLISQDLPVFPPFQPIRFRQQTFPTNSRAWQSWNGIRTVLNRAANERSAKTLLFSVVSYLCLKCETTSRHFQPGEGAFSVIVKTGCGTDGALHSTIHNTSASDYALHNVHYLRAPTTIMLSALFSNCLKF